MLLGNRGINFSLTLVVHVLLIVISPCNVLWMRKTTEQKSATMVTTNLKVSTCRDIMANSNITKSYCFNCNDSCSTDVNTPLNAISVHEGFWYAGLCMAYKKFARRHADIFSKYYCSVLSLCGWVFVWKVSVCKLLWEQCLVWSDKGVYSCWQGHLLAFVLLGDFVRLAVSLLHTFVHFLCIFYVFS